MRYFTRKLELVSDISWVIVVRDSIGISFPPLDTDGPQDSRGREGSIPYSSLPLPPAHEQSKHPFTTLHVRWLSRIPNRSACVYQNATRWDLPPYRIINWVIDWWCNVCWFTWWIDTRFLLQRFDNGNRSIRTPIDYHPCITSARTNQVC